MRHLTTAHLGGVLVITLNDPRRRNVLSAALSEELSTAVRRAADDSAVQALIITGAGSAFCAGASLEDLEAAAHGSMEPINAVYRAFMDVAESPLPTLAAVNGPAVGAGLNLALACDMRVAAPNALFETRFLKLGLHPGGGHAWMLQRAVGWANAARMLFSGQSLTAAQAEGIGLVQEVVLEADLMPSSVNALRACASTSRELVLRTKATMRLAVQSDHQAAFAHESSEQRWSLMSPGFSTSASRSNRAARE